MEPDQRDEVPAPGEDKEIAATKTLLKAAGEVWDAEFVSRPEMNTNKPTEWAVDSAADVEWVEETETEAYKIKEGLWRKRLRFL